MNIILVSLVLAFGINFFIFDGTNISKNLKTSIIDSKINEEKSDIFIDNIDGKLYIISNKYINKIDSLSLSIIYNPENVNINKMNSSFGDIVNLTNTPGVSSIILTTNIETNIKPGDKLIEINIIKTENITENLNIVNANFKDTKKQHYLLSTSGITF